MRLLPLFFFLLTTSFCLHAQPTEALEIAKAAITKMDNGEIEEALALLEKAWKMDPKNQLYPYKIGYAHYLNGWEFWLDTHREEFDAFVDWFNANPLEIPEDKVMVRATF